MQYIFINIDHIPIEDRPPENDDYCCMEISIPDNCPHCKMIIKVGNSGNKLACGWLLHPICGHFERWSDLWRNRIKENTLTFNYVDPINDGCKCNKCGLWSPMSAPNQSDDTFKCYSCRNRGW